MNSLKESTIKVWKIITITFMLMAGFIVYLVTKNKKLLIKVMQGDAESVDAILEEKKSGLQKEQEKLEQDSEDLKRKTAAQKKDMSPEDIEKFYNGKE